MAACTSLAWVPVARAGPITFQTALPIHADEVLVREQVIWTHADGGPAPENATVNVLSVPTLVVWGMHERVAAFVSLPFVYKDAELTTPTGERRRRTALGFSDLELLLRVSVIQENGPGETFRVAPFAGLGLPTGPTREADALGTLPPDLQIGSGAWAPRVGAVLTYQTLDYELDVAVEGLFAVPNEELDRGDEVRVSASFQGRVFPWGELGGGVPTFLYLVAETQVGWIAPDTGSLAPLESGGFYWWLTPGIQLVTMRWVLEAAVEIPVFQPAGGHIAARSRMSVRLSF